MSKYKKEVTMIYCKKYMLAILLFFNLSALAQSDSEGHPVCATNDYALCSHAECTCLDANGNAGDCQPYPGDISDGVVDLSLIHI